MPYIEPKFREKFINDIQTDPDNAGELNYVISRLLYRYYKIQGARYLTICIIMGTLICVALEFYRKIAVPYEDFKCAENGEVFK